MQKKEKYKKAIFAAGCFWGVEQSFYHLPGVIETKVGYIGGIKENPTYEQVSSKKTGHAEAVEVTYDPHKISYGKLLDTFWQIHDPTTLNRQGPDIGSNYRSAIFYLDDEQKNIALKSKEKMQNTGLLKDKIVTEITKATKFWSAEDYHQKYFLKNPGHGCHI